MYWMPGWFFGTVAALIIVYLSGTKNCVLAILLGFFLSIVGMIVGTIIEKILD